MKKRIISVLLTGFMVFSLAACGKEKSGTGGKSDSGDKITLVMSNVTTDSAKKAGEKFAELISEYSNGTIEVDHFPDNQLGDDKTVVENTQLGEVDITVASTSSIATVYPDYYLYDTPYLFLNQDEVYDVGFGGEAGKKVMEGVDSIGLKGVAMWENGFRNYTNNEVEVKNPDDVKGMKIRTMENEIHLKAWSALGANPTPMAFSELFTALQQGTVDGQENPLGIIASNKFYEVQKYISLTQHVYTPYCVVMNPDKYESFTEEQKTAFDKAMSEATKFQIDESHKADVDAVKLMEDADCQVTELTDEQKAEFQKRVEEADIFSVVKDKMKNPDLFDKMIEELDSYRK